MFLLSCFESGCVSVILFFQKSTARYKKNQEEINERGASQTAIVQITACPLDRKRVAPMHRMLNDKNIKDKIINLKLCPELIIDVTPLVS